MVGENEYIIINFEVRVSNIYIFQFENILIIFQKKMNNIQTVSKIVIGHASCRNIRKENFYFLE